MRKALRNASKAIGLFFLPDADPIYAELDCGSGDSAEISRIPIHPFLAAEHNVVILLVENGRGGFGMDLFAIQIPSQLARCPEESIVVEVR
jgi:hypothetical protein